MELILTPKAYRSIVEECASFPDRETGGILIGKKINGRIVAPFAIGSGPKAKRLWVRYSPDVEWQQETLDKLFTRYQVNYVGSFHRHPGIFGQPSRVDLKTARKILSSPGWNISEAIFPIIILQGRRIELHPYYISRTSRKFQSIPWQIVSQKDRLVRAVLGRRKK